MHDLYNVALVHYDQDMLIPLSSGARMTQNEPPMNDGEFTNTEYERLALASKINLSDDTPGSHSLAINER